MMSEAFLREYDRVIKAAGAYDGAMQGDAYVREVQAAVQGAVDLLKRVAASGAKDVDYLKGDLAEAWHAGTLMVDAVRQGKTNVWADVPRNRSPVDVKYGDGTAERTAQMKYYKTAEETAKAISDPKFDGIDQKIVPKEQLQGVRKEAERLAAKNAASRPEQAEQHRHTAATADDRMRSGGSESTPLSEPESKRMAREFKKGEFDPDKHGLNTESFVQWSDLAREAGEAAVHAALLTAALKAAPHIWRLLDRLIRDGEVDVHELQRGAVDVITGAGSAGLRGGLAAGLTVACRSGIMGASLKAAPPAAIGAAVAVAMNAVSYGLQLARGEINTAQFAENCVRDSLLVSCGVLGASVGQALIPIPLLGGLIGNIVGTALGTVVYHGGRSLLIGLCVDRGWTFFGLVTQDYHVPETILQRAGFDLFTTKSFSNESFTVASFSTQSFSTSSLQFQVLRRGLVRCDVVGYA